jgi:hypothetical protein
VNYLSIRQLIQAIGQAGGQAILDATDSGGAKNATGLRNTGLASDFKESLLESLFRESLFNSELFQDSSD